MHRGSVRIFGIENVVAKDLTGKRVVHVGRKAQTDLGLKMMAQGAPRVYS
jgi:hypothetical protein